MLYPHPDNDEVGSLINPPANSKRLERFSIAT